MRLTFAGRYVGYTERLVEFSATNSIRSKFVRFNKYSFKIIKKGALAPSFQQLNGSLLVDLTGNLCLSIGNVSPNSRPKTSFSAFSSFFFLHLLRVSYTTHKMI